MHELSEPYLPLPSQLKLVVIYVPGIEGWVGLGTTTVSKLSVQDRYVTAITVAITPQWAIGAQGGVELTSCPSWINMWDA